MGNYAINQSLHKQFCYTKQMATDAKVRNILKDISLTTGPNEPGLSWATQNLWTLLFFWPLESPREIIVVEWLRMYTNALA